MSPTRAATAWRSSTGTQDYCVGANWKLLQENSADGYHGVPTHSTYFDYIRSRDNATFTSMNSKGWVKNLGNGHAVSDRSACCRGAAPMRAGRRAGARRPRSRSRR